MRHITIVIEHQPENVYLATSDDMPGFNVEHEDREQIFTLSRELALEYLQMDNIKPDDIVFDFEVKQ
jgi:predicted RNase H-like HicB family nuclease